jgi:cytochrome c biogenesis protein CcmG, thiol:disulfide interchange protein DsbE
VKPLTRRAFFSLPLLAAIPAPAAARVPAVGEAAPDARMRLVDGTEVHLSELRGQVVVLNWWATWCVPCRQELPLLDSYYRLQRAHGMRVFAITTEDSLPIARLRRVFEAMEITAVRSIRGPYRILDGVPTNYVIDRSGRLRYARAGAFTLDALNSILVPLLNEPAPAA